MGSNTVAPGQGLQIPPFRFETLQIPVLGPEILRVLGQEMVELADRGRAHPQPLQLTALRVAPDIAIQIALAGGDLALHRSLLTNRGDQITVARGNGMTNVLGAVTSFAIRCESPPAGVVPRADAVFSSWWVRRRNPARGTGAGRP